MRTVRRPISPPYDPCRRRRFTPPAELPKGSEPVAVCLAWSGVSEAPAGARRSDDPLGFRTVATSVARALVPGLTQSTNHVRGFSLLALGWKLAHEVHQPAQSQKAAAL